MQALSTSPTNPARRIIRYLRSKCYNNSNMQSRYLIIHDTHASSKARKDTLKRPISISLLLLLAILTACFSLYYVSSETPIYVWGYRNYWEKYWRFGELLAQQPYDALRDLRVSFRHRDYNASPIIPLVPFYFLFERSRAAYITLLTLLYLVPTVLLSTWYAWRTLNRNYRLTDKWLLFFGLYALCFTPYWQPTLRGYPDIVGMIPLIVAVIGTDRLSPATRQTARKILSIGVLLWLCFLFRRWYAYSVVTFIVTLGLQALYDVYDIRKDHTALRKETVAVLINTLLLIVPIIALSLVFQRDLVHRILNTDYADIYDAYQLDSLQHIIHLYNYFGPVVLSLAAVGASGVIFASRLRRSIMFCTINAVVLFCIFVRTQKFGEQHYLPLGFWLYALSCFGFLFLAKTLGKGLRETMFVLISSSLLMSSFLAVFVLKDARTVFWAPNHQSLPIRYEQYSEYRRLVLDLDKLLANSVDKVSVFASSEIMSDSLLLAMSTDSQRAHIQAPSQVDKRDRLQLNAFQSRYALVADPEQTHLRRGSQTVITIPVEQLLQQRGIGAAYTRLPGRYLLEKGVAAYIYEKVRPFTLTESLTFLGAFLEHYPDWSADYNDLAPLFLSSHIERDGTGGKVTYLDDNTMSIQPGGGRTRVNFSLVGRLERAVIEMEAEPAASLPRLHPERGPVMVRLLVDGKAMLSEIISPTNPRSLHINAAGAKSFDILVDNVEENRRGSLLLRVLQARYTGSD